MFTEKAQQLKDESNINSDSLDYSNIFVSEVEPFWFQLIEVAEWFGLSTYRNSNKILKKRTLFCYEKVTFKVPYNVHLIQKFADLKKMPVHRGV